MELPQDIITPGPAEFIHYLLAVGDLPAARRWQAYQIYCGRVCALEGGLFNPGATQAWQRGYVEALQDLER